MWISTFRFENMSILWDKSILIDCFIALHNFLILEYVHLTLFFKKNVKESKFKKRCLSFNRCIDNLHYAQNCSTLGYWMTEIVKITSDWPRHIFCIYFTLLFITWDSFCQRITYHQFRNFRHVCIPLNKVLSTTITNFHSLFKKK